jgi:4-diphosphocytidyl-2-C-methyl-D-erythritol kinase
LLALNRLWDANLSRAQLAVLGEKIGADVPFFIGGHNAWVEGIGEKLTPIVLPRARFAVVKPPAGVQTTAIFGHAALSRSTPAAIISGFAANTFAFGANDLQPVAQMLCPDVMEALQWLGSQGLKARMTGSGSAVFAQLSARLPAQWSSATAPSGWLVRECSNMDVHPLARWASSDD